MGRLLLLWRLIARDLRRRPGEAVMFLLAVTAATTSLALGMATDDAVGAAYLKTRDATAGPDVTAITTAADPSAVAERLAGTPGVVAHSDPVFAFDTTVRAHGRSARSAVEGRDGGPSAVDRPLVTSGTWVRPGGVVVERSFAQVLGVDVGDRVTLTGRDYPVVGIALSVATGVYPGSDWAQGPGTSDYGGRVWLTTADTRAAAGDTPGVHLIHLKLSDPAAITQWTDAAFPQDDRGGDWVNVRSWQDVLDQDTKFIMFARPALVVGGWLLGGAAVVTLAALTALRAGRDDRRAGLLKAVGATPGAVAAVLLAQHLLLTALAAALGLTAGSLLAPELADPSAGLINTVSPPATDTVVGTVLLAAVVAGAGVLGPVLRAARTSTVDSLADPAQPPVRHPRLNAVTAYLPTSLLIGVRLLARRPGRAVLTTVGAGVTSVMVTALLTLHAVPDVEIEYGLSHPGGLRDIVTVRTVTGVTYVLVALSVLNTVFLGWSTAVRARRALTVTRTLGATPGQVVTALCTAQLLPAALGVAVGTPAGLVLYNLFSRVVIVPPGSWLLLAASAVLLTAGVLTALPAWAHTRGPAGRALHAGPA
ncbi:FtsX-like permease family protein [Streptomyces sp. NPDC090994]|uniref:FtsX-like permease family protein n=1 Tax=Streptomyces sp. NPDC090994 TaxID=3365969 RepID=UPI00380433DE